jgi:hypothetical protein
MNFNEKRFYGFSWTGESIRLPIRHIEVRILPAPARQSGVLTADIPVFGGNVSSLRQASE